MLEQKLKCDSPRYCGSKVTIEEGIEEGWFEIYASPYLGNKSLQTSVVPFSGIPSALHSDIGKILHSCAIHLVDVIKGIAEDFASEVAKLRSDEEETAEALTKGAKPAATEEPL